MAVVGSGEFRVDVVLGRNVQHAFNNLTEGANKALRTLQELEREFREIRQFTQAGLIDKGSGAAALQETNKGIRELGGETRRLSLNIRSSTQEQLANAKTVQQLRSQYNLLDKQLAASAQKTAALNQLQAKARSIGGDLATEASKLRNHAQQAGGAVGLMGQASAKATAILSRFGLTMRDLNVIVGAGFLSTAGPALLVLLGIGIVKAAAKAVKAIAEFSLEAAKMADALRESQEEVEAIFGESAAGIERFAERSAFAFGTTEQAALAFAAKTGRYFESIGIGADSAVRLSEGLLGAAEVLRRTTGEFISSETALQAVNDLVGGNIEGLRKLGIRLTESGLKAVAFSHGLKVGEETLNDTQKGILATIAALEAAKSRFEDARDQPESLAEAFERFRAILTTVKTELGQELMPVIEFGGRVLIGMAVAVLTLVRAFKQVRERSEGAIEVFGRIAKIVSRMSPGLFLLSKAAERFAEVGKEVKDSAMDDILEGIDDALREATGSWNDLNKAQDRTPEGIKALIDAYKNLEKTIRDAARAEEDAVEAVAKTRKDAAKSIKDAEENLAEAREDRVKAIKDARENLKEAEEDAAKSIADAEENLREARLENNKRVLDAERALHDARKQQRKEILDASVALSQAQLAEDAVAINAARLALRRAKDGEGVANAELNLQEAKREAVEDLREAEEALAEARVEAAEKIAEAEEKLADTIVEQRERVLEAEDRLTEAREQAAERILEAEERLVEVREKNKEAINEAILKVQELEGAWDEADGKIEHMIRNLEKLRRKHQELIGAEQGRGAYNDPIYGSDLSGNWSGGPVYAHHPYIVGEKGPELFIPSSHGRIDRNDDLKRDMARQQMTQGGDTNISVYEAVDAQATAAAVNARIARGVRT